MGLEPDPDPHPTIPNINAKTSRPSKIHRERRRELAPTSTIPKTPTLPRLAQRSSPPDRRFTGSIAVFGPVVVTVSVAVTAPPLGVTDVGLNVQLMPLPSPLAQERETSELNPFCGVTASLNVAALPAVTVAEVVCAPKA